MTKNEINKAIGSKLKAARKSLKLTTADVGIFLGLTPCAVGNIERARNSTDVDTFMRLCELYGVKFIDLMPDELKPLVA